MRKQFMALVLAMTVVLSMISVKTTYADTEVTASITETEEEESITLDAPSITSARNTKVGIRITWDSTDDAEGYKIYRKVDSTSIWTKVKTIKSGSTTAWTDKDVREHNKYTYTVQAYNADTESSYGNQKKSFYYLPATYINSLQNTGEGELTIYWEPLVMGSNSYDQVCYSTSKSFTKSKSVKVKGCAAKTISGLSEGKTYYIKVRSVSKINGKKYYSAWSSVKKVKVSYPPVYN